MTVRIFAGMRAFPVCILGVCFAFALMASMGVPCAAQALQLPLGAGSLLAHPQSDDYPLVFVDADGTSDNAITVNVYAGGTTEVAYKLKNTSSSTVTVTRCKDDPTASEEAGGMLERSVICDDDSAVPSDEYDGYEIAPGVTATFKLKVSADGVAPYTATYQFQIVQDHWEQEWAYDGETNQTTLYMWREIDAVQTAPITLKMNVYNPAGATLTLGTSAGDPVKSFTQLPASGINLGTIDLTKLSESSYDNDVRFDFYIKNTSTTKDTYTGAIPVIDGTYEVEPAGAMAMRAGYDNDVIYCNGPQFNQYTYNGVPKVTITFDPTKRVAGTYTADFTMHTVPYGVKVNGKNTSATGDITIPVTVKLTGANPNLPGRVTGLTAKAGNGLVELNWNEVGNLAKFYNPNYEIWRHDGDLSLTAPDSLTLYDGWTKVGSTSSGNQTTRFVDKTVENGKAYTYTVICGSPYQGYPATPVACTPDATLVKMPPTPYLNWRVYGYVGYVGISWDLDEPQTDEGEDGDGSGEVDHFNVYKNGRLVAVVDQNANDEEVHTYSNGSMNTSHRWTCTVPSDMPYQDSTYWVTAVGPDGTEGYPSDSATCSSISEVPVIVRMSAGYGSIRYDDAGKRIDGVAISPTVYGENTGWIKNYTLWRSDKSEPVYSGGELGDMGYLYDETALPNKTYTYTLQVTDGAEFVSEPYSITIKTVPVDLGDGYIQQAIQNTDAFAPVGTNYARFEIRNGTTPVLNFDRWSFEGYTVTYKVVRDDKVVETLSANNENFEYSETPTVDGTYTYRVDKVVNGVEVRGTDFVYVRDTSPIDESAFTQLPAAPVLTGRVSGEGVLLNWTVSDEGGEPEGFHIYRTDGGELVAGGYRMNYWGSVHAWGHNRYLTIKDGSVRTLADGVASAYLDDEKLGLLYSISWYNEDASPHEYYITAYNERGESARSNLVSFASTEDGKAPANPADEAPGAPVITRAWVDWDDKSGTDWYPDAFAENMSGTVHVAFEAPATGGAVDEYVVSYESSDDSYTSPMTIPAWKAQTLPETFEGTGWSLASVFSSTVDNKATYTIKVTAVNAAGFRASVPVELAINGVPQLMVLPGSGRVALKWSSGLFHDGTSVTGWELYKQPELGLLEKVGSFDAATHECVDADVTNNWTYSYYVVAKTAEGDRASATKSATPSVTGEKPATPANLNWRVQDGVMLLTWDQPETGGVPTEYEYQYWDEDYEQWFGNTLGKASPTGAALDNYGYPFELDQEVRIKVRAKNKAGASEWSDELSVKMTTAQSQQAAKNVPDHVVLHGEALEGACRLWWSTSSDADYPKPTYYTVKKGWIDESGLRWIETTVAIPAKGTGIYDYEYVDENVTPGVTYTYTVEACNAAGGSGYWENVYDQKLTPLGKDHDRMAASQVAELIRALPAPDEVTSDNAEQITAVKAAYDQLTDVQKRMIDNYEGADLAPKLAGCVDAVELIALREKYADVVAPVQDAIRKLPAAGVVELTDAQAIQAVRAAYEALPGEARRLVDVSDLTAAEKALAAKQKEAADKEMADKVADAIGKIDVAGLSLDDGDVLAAITAARAAYDALSPEARALVDSTALAKLEAAEAQVKALEDQAAADAVLARIAALPPEESLTLADRPAVDSALAAYAALTSDQKALVDGAGLDARNRLESARACIDVLEAQAAEAARIDVSTGEAVLQDASFTYTGKPVRPAVLRFEVNGVQLVEGKDFSVGYSGNVNAGTGKVTLEGVGKYKGVKTVPFTIGKAANALKVKGKTVKVKRAKLKKRAQKFSIAKFVKFAGKGQGRLVFSKKAGNRKIAVNKTTGKIKLKKGLKRKTYKVKVSITALGDANHAAKTETVAFRVKVK